MCNRCERASCVCACRYACITCLREGELPACDMYVRACMYACVTCLREAELPACPVCVIVWMRALPAWGGQNCQPVMCMCLCGCMCAFFNLLEGERTARLWYVCACVYVCVHYPLEEGRTASLWHSDSNRTWGQTGCEFYPGHFRCRYCPTDRARNP